ncbi:MAG: 2-oxoglutarate dehydrogenase E1 component [Bacteroidota bacterium]
MDSLSDMHNIDFSVLEALYEQYKSDPDCIDSSWSYFFKGFELSQTQYKKPAQLNPDDNQTISNEFKVINLINAYRERGHYFTLTNPVRTRRKYLPTLDLENFGLNETHLEQSFHAGNEIGIGNAKLSEIIAMLQQTYCRSIGVEYMYIRKPEIINWLKHKMESAKNTPSFSKSIKKQILQKIAQAVHFEKFIHTKFPGQKSFSLEGSEALIPALSAIINKGAELKYQEFVIGMPHRGRLNVLANILHKPYEEIFSEFEGKPFDEESLVGDVKYHLGYSSNYAISETEKIHVTLCPNPSHLEAVDAVVEGIVRAKNDTNYGSNTNSVLPILIHGDASIAGQGIVYEVLQMSELDAFKTGGTIHLVVNNQLGFTTNYLDARSSVYCTDVAKIVQSPIFHVNGDDLEAVVNTVLLAMEYRHEFHKDVFIDLLCYRKYGHNESDEPRFTQPILYKIIENHPDPLKIYSSKLLSEGIITQDELKDYEKNFYESLETNLLLAKLRINASISPFLKDLWKNIRKAVPEDFQSSVTFPVDSVKLLELGNKISKLPDNKTFFRKIVKLQNDRHEMVFKTHKLDWALCELLAYATLLTQQFPVRLCGQDIKRGTFSQRHAVLTVEDSEEEYIPLKNLSADQAEFAVHNSLLSEYGVLGFEYGYALATPETLTVWEAQFGDFFNGGQIIIDQFISCAEEKWNVFNGLVLYLPHGYEGQGPEHSSGRIERFLTLCADHNIQIANCTTPANFFHILRRQVLRNFRKPLILFTPKSLLRHPACVSSMNDLCEGRFEMVIDDTVANKTAIKRIILCSGKVYYDLAAEKQRAPRPDVVIIRIEQLYPFPKQDVDALIKSYANASEFLWVQEEPANMGAATFIRKNLCEMNLLFVTRPISGSPATGSSQTHKQTQTKLIEKAFGNCTCDRKDDECNMNCTQEEI